MYAFFSYFLSKISQKSVKYFSGTKSRKFVKALVQVIHLIDHLYGNKMIMNSPSYIFLV